MSSNKPIALVTGGSRGIGAAISQKLAHDGFHVLINFQSNHEAAQKIQESIKIMGGTADLCGFDVSDPQAVTDAFSQLVKNHGVLQVLVNNAGITADSLILRMKNEDIDRVINTDLKGAMYCSREAAKLMIKERKGSIIQIGSVVGEMGNPGQSNYAAAKAGLIGFSKSLARELASRKIRVNVVTPGFIATEMTSVLTESQKEVILRSIPLGELGNVQDVSALVSFLASDGGRYITGQVIGVNGGLYI